MPRAKEAMLMPKPYIKFLIIFWIVLLALQGCSTTPHTEVEASSSQIAVPPEARAEFTRALEMLKSSQPGVALQLFQQLATRYPQLAGVHVNIGIIHLQNNKTTDAISALKRAVQMNPANPSAHHHLGIAFRQAGQFNAAKESYLQALKIKPEYSSAHLNLAILYDLYFQQQELALEHYQQFQQLSTNKDKKVANWIIDLERRVKAKQQGGS